ncbi:MAG: Gfo/Idh/MocA family oxidoreductase [Clostridia bacterium]|nr:Gfo/Idh/MocA family oxidoreductase [Clostridia bacterium]
MYKIAILGCENSHADVFLKLIYTQKLVTDVECIGIYSNEPEEAERLHVKYGVPVASSYDAFVGQIDGLIITARDGDNHYPYAKPYLDSGIPMFIDKPITNTEEDALAFIKELKERHIPITGGSCVIHAQHLKELAKIVKEKPDGEIVGGYLRAPMDYDNIYGGFHFYAQHLVQAMCTVFGYDPLSVHSFKKGGVITCVVHYPTVNVTLDYVDRCYKIYYAAVSSETKFAGDTYPVTDCFVPEFMEFYRLLQGGTQSQSYRDFIVPVMIINAIHRGLESGKEEFIRQLEEI